MPHDERFKRFIDVAKEAGADEMEAGADRAIKTIKHSKQRS
jgi:hypothetical protein